VYDRINLCAEKKRKDRDYRICYLLLKLIAATVVDLKPNEYTARFKSTRVVSSVISTSTCISSTIKNNNTDSTAETAKRSVGCFFAGV
jgi:hypothetical protein